MATTIEQLIESYKKGASPVETVQDLLHKISASDLNAFISVQKDQALKQARELAASAPKEERPLHGIAIGVKDLIDVQGAATTMGAEGYDGNIAPQDARVVARLRAAGAILIGKTNTHQFAYGPMGDRSASGPTLNPLDLTRMTGGSSSGSAAAVAAGLVHAAVGSDTAASIRLPAAFCGVVGIKPTAGLIPDDGAFPLSKTLDHLGPITAGCHDNARVLAVMAGKAANVYSALIGKPLDGLVVGLPDSFFNTHWSESVTKAMERAVETLKESGVQVRPVSIADIDQIYEAQQRVLRFEAYALHADRLAAGKPYEPEVRERLMAGREVTHESYQQALAYRPNAKAHFDAALQKVDIILTPTCGITAPTLQERETVLNGETVSTRWLLTRLTAPTNFSGHPSLSVPFGKDGQGMPIGLQLVGRYHDEALLYQVGSFLAGERT